MNGKRVLNFLLLRPAMTTRNLTSLGLVAFFFAVFYLSGGRIAAVPRITPGATFGGIAQTEQIPSLELRGDVLKEKPPAPEVKQEARQENRRGLMSGVKENGLIGSIKKSFDSTDAQKNHPAEDTSKKSSENVDGDLADLKARLNRLGSTGR